MQRAAPTEAPPRIDVIRAGTRTRSAMPRAGVQLWSRSASTISPPGVGFRNGERHASMPRDGERSWKRKDEQVAPLGGVIRQVAHCADETECCRRIARVEIANHDGARPTAYTGEDADVLLAIGPAIANRLADHAGRQLDLPKQLTGFGMKRFEPAVHRAVKDEIALGG